MATPYVTQAAGSRTDGRDSYDDTLPPPLDPRQWRRPYRVGGYRVAAATLLLAVCPMLMLGALLSYLAGGTSRAVTVGTGALVLVALALRILRMGVYVSSRGLRRAGLWHTRTVRWAQIGELGVRQEPVRVLGTPRRANGQSVYVVRRTGTRLDELVTTHNADFLSRSRREDFESAVDSLTSWGRRCAPGIPVPSGRPDRAV